MELRAVDGNATPVDTKQTRGQDRKERSCKPQLSAETTYVKLQISSTREMHWNASKLPRLSAGPRTLTKRAVESCWGCERFHRSSCATNKDILNGNTFVGAVKLLKLRGDERLQTYLPEEATDGNST